MKIKEELIQKYSDAVEFHDVMPGTYIFRYPTISFQWIIDYRFGNYYYSKVGEPYTGMHMRTARKIDTIEAVGQFIKYMEKHDGPTHCPVIVAYSDKDGPYCFISLFCFSDVGST